MLKAEAGVIGDKRCARMKTQAKTVSHIAAHKSDEATKLRYPPPTLPSSPSHPPAHLFLCLSDYLYISICLSESTGAVCTHTLTSCQRHKKSWQMVIWLYVWEANVRAMSQSQPRHPGTAQPEGPAKMKRRWQAVALDRSKQQQER